jgi:hypothetical protein
MMTARVIPFFRDVSFDPDTTHIMGQAFDDACKALPNVVQSDLVKYVIAKRIIQIAKNGERNPNQLCKRALQALGLDVTEPKTGGRQGSPKPRHRRSLSKPSRSPLSVRI